MKSRFTTYDIVCAVTELQKLVGLRINQIYDIDHKTYLIRFQGSIEKPVLLIESGIRFHTTAFQWPKNDAPSGFCMKLRKHLKNKRLEELRQIGSDRIVDFRFGSAEAAYHLILELYDRGNIFLTDYEYRIVYLLRPHIEGENTKFSVRELYPLDRAKKYDDNVDENDLKKKLATATGDLRRILITVVDGGGALVDHVLKKHGLENKFLQEKDSGCVKQEKKSQNASYFDIEKDFPILLVAINEAREMLNTARNSVHKGYIIQKKEEKLSAKGETGEDFIHNLEFHPFLFAQFQSTLYAEFPSFVEAVDEFFSKLEAQRIDLQVFQHEKEALKKLSNVRKDHEKRLENLAITQEEDRKKAELISSNQDLVDKAILAIRSALASQMSWNDIGELVKAAQEAGDPAAKIIHRLKLNINHICLKLMNNDFAEVEERKSLEASEERESEKSFAFVDIDLALSAWGNACKYYEQKRHAAQKQEKTINASEKALKSAEKKTQQVLKEVQTISNIVKTRKIYWFEKFYWFISSENYLVIGGRDAQQNELIVKRYMRPTDIYVHADIQGASSIVIRNPFNAEVPPKTLLEAGSMAVCYSVSWDAKVVTSAYWVYSHQVNKTAPSGEYLGTGSFMIHGKKNFLPSCNLIMGLSLLFKLEESFVERHKGERKVRLAVEDDNKDALQKNGYQTKELADLAKDTLESNYLKDATSALELPKEVHFPDIQVNVRRNTEEIFGFPRDITQEIKLDDSQEVTIIPAMQPRKKQQTANKRKEIKAPKGAHHQVNCSNEDKSNSLQVKRGHKGKLKKIKAKYKYQDDEERELRMQILKSSGKDKTNISDNMPKSSKEDMPFNQKQWENANQHESQDDDDLTFLGEDDVLDSFTGQPLDDDELLFAVPVVAPYQALQNYKYKAKIIPGTGKRGKVAKAALVLFTKEKNSGRREKDLLKGIKEESIARNLPGKVKLSIPSMPKH